MRFLAYFAVILNDEFDLLDRSVDVINRVVKMECCASHVLPDWEQFNLNLLTEFMSFVCEDLKMNGRNFSERR